MIVFIWNKLSSKNIPPQLTAYCFISHCTEHSRQLFHRLLRTLGEDIGNFETRHISGHFSFPVRSTVGLFFLPSLLLSLHLFLSFPSFPSFFSSPNIKILRLSVSNRESQIDSQYTISWYKHFKDDFWLKKKTFRDGHQVRLIKVHTVVGFKNTEAELFCAYLLGRPSIYFLCGRCSYDDTIRKPQMTL